jgi:hypothetical protein
VPGGRSFVNKNKDVQRLNGLQIINSNQYVLFENGNMEIKVKTIDTAFIEREYFLIENSIKKFSTKIFGS